MDPFQTYRDMMDAIQEHDLEHARSLALALRRWLGSGGFYPHQLPRETLDAAIADVLWQTANLDRKCPPAVAVFSLTCAYCDAGMGIQTEGEALDQGWSRIQETDLPEATHLGVCPDCLREEEQ